MWGSSAEESGSPKSGSQEQADKEAEVGRAGLGGTPLPGWSSLAGWLQPLPVQQETLTWVRSKASATWRLWHHEGAAQPLMV